MIANNITITRTLFFCADQCNEVSVASDQREQDIISLPEDEGEDSLGKIQWNSAWKVVAFL